MGRMSKSDDTSGGIGFGRPVCASTNTQLVSPRATTAWSLSRRKRYFRNELAFLSVETHVRMRSRSSANVDCRYSTWWLRITQKAAAADVAVVQPAASECEVAAACI